ncbi:SNF2 domain-containing protein CLASSY 3-like isoform X3 [Primulina huaijiensis]|uniref:SNF2 domain-containing protein CLASSY 3-like isoform X3 n=1 Tax=Primulina huaijiensis TaxID=1492673 RepID=UPI003CC71A40
MDLNDIEIERIDEAEFRNKRTHSMPRPSTRQESDEGCSAATSRKHVAGNGREDMVPHGVEIEEIDEAEFRTRKPLDISKTGPSNGQEINEGYGTTSWKSVDGVRKNISYSALCGSLSPKDANNESGQGQPNKWRPCVEKGNDNEDMDPEKVEIERIDEDEFRNKKTYSAPSIAPSTRQKQSECCSRKKFECVNKKISNFHSGSLSCGDVSVDSNGDSDKSSSFMKEGNGVEDTDPQKVEIDIIDEAEFRNKKMHCVPKGAPSTRQKLNKRYSAAASRKKVKCVSKKISNFHFCSLPAEDVSVDSNGDPYKSSSFVKKAMANEAEEIEFEMMGKNCINIEDSIDFRRKKIDQGWDKNLHDDVNSCYHEWINSNSSIQSKRKSNMSGEDDDFLKAEKICSSGLEHDNELGIANRTRSKTRIVKKSPDADKYLSSSESIFESRDDEDFRKSSLSDSWEPQYYDVQDIESVKVSAAKCSDYSKKERNAVMRSSKKWHFPNLDTEEAKCDQLSCSFRKKRLRIDASSKRNEEGTSYKPNKVPEENYHVKTILCDDSNEEEVFKNKSDGIEENLLKCPKLDQLFTQKHGDEAGASGSKDHSKDEDSDPIDFGVQTGCSQATSGFHVHDNNDKLPVADGTKRLRKRKQVSSKRYDFWKLMADSVLERGQMPEEIESDEGAKQAPAPKLQNNLPLKFRFEDELPNAVEKTEYEKEIEGLFAELDFSWASGQMGSFNFPEVNNVDTNAHGEETQQSRCARGDHELFLQDDMGLICIYCPHVELGPRDVMPMWVEKNCRGSGRTRSSEMGQLPEFDQLDLTTSSAHDFTDFDNNGNGTVWDVKPGIKESMYKHQQEGFEFLWKNLAGSINLAELRSSDPSGVGGCIISHAPGTGKTRLTIVFVETYLKLFPSCRPVIIAPASMLLTWEEEFKKWNVEFPFYNLNNLEFLGNENNTALRLFSGLSGQNKELIRMVKIYSWHRGRSILGISYSLYEKLAGEKYREGKKREKNKRVAVDNKCEALRKILLEKPELVVLDEGHTPRNERSNIWNALLKLHTKKRVILSGTPFQNNFAELFNTLRLVRPAFADVLSQAKIFAAEMITSRKMPRRKREGKNARSISKAINSAVEKLKLSMSPFVHVHKGTILQQSLPGLRDCVVLLKPPALQKSLIDRIEGLQSTFEFEHKVALISVHPYLLQFCGSVEKQWLGIDMGAIEASKLNPNEGVKTKFIFELVRLSLAMNEKVLIFSQYIQPLELIKDQLKEIFMWVDGKQIFQMQGKLDQRQRQLMINTFNDPQSEAKVMLASTKCCSEGISLVGASRLVLLDVVWNPSVEHQAISRAYRIGQKKYVYTYHLMTSGTTESDKYCRQAEKERLSELVFTSSSNEGEKHKQPATGIEDRILEEMVGHANLNAMFEKIINQPKDTDLIQTFCLTS